MLSTDSEFTSLTDKDANDRYHEQFIEFKNNQNNLADSERVKILFQNQYWLVNKNQDLWVGFFDGKKIKVPGGVYPDMPAATYLPQQIIRIKMKGKLSQFIIKSTGIKTYGHPLHCYNKIDAVLVDKPDYLLFYSGCTDIIPRNDGRRNVTYDILFYSKIFDTLVSVNSFTSSEIIDVKSYADALKNKDVYFVYEKTYVAFRIKGKDKVEDVDPDTGAQLNRDDDSEDTDGVQVLPFERLPDIKNK